MPPKSSRFRGVTLFRPTGKWRAQISVGGQTTSLGDHDTEEEAARAFDRAAIHFKGKAYAATNYELQEYADELPSLLAMTQAELVSELRARARKSSRPSMYHGVSRGGGEMNYWHASITVNGKRVHLGMYATEVAAARAYDKAALHAGAEQESKGLKGAVVTNLHVSQYDEVELAEMKSLSMPEVAQRLAMRGLGMAAGITTRKQAGVVTNKDKRGGANAAEQGHNDGGSSGASDDGSSLRRQVSMASVGSKTGENVLGGVGGGGGGVKGKVRSESPPLSPDFPSSKKRRKHATPSRASAC